MNKQKTFSIFGNEKEKNIKINKILKEEANVGDIIEYYPPGNQYYAKSTEVILSIVGNLKLSKWELLFI